MGSVQKYCNECGANRKCTDNTAGGLEQAIWFILAFFTMGFTILILIWRCIGGSAICDTCGSKKLSSPK